MKRILIVKGLNASQDSIEALRIRYSKFQIDEVKYWENYSYNYYLYVGHSTGAMRIQNDLKIQSYKIHTYGAPVHFRGKKIQGFIDGHPVTLS